MNEDDHCIYCGKSGANTIVKNRLVGIKNGRYHAACVGKAKRAIENQIKYRKLEEKYKKRII